MHKKNGLYYVSRHSCFLLQYHMVLVTKYRKPILYGPVKEYVYELIEDTLKSRGCNVIAINGEEDHVHIFFEAGPETSIMETANVLKTRTARLTRKKYPAELKKYFWGEKPLFWTDSYFATTVGYNNSDTVTRYINNRGRD